MSDTLGICICGHSEADHEVNEDGEVRACMSCLDCKRYDEAVSLR